MEELQNDNQILSQQSERKWLRTVGVILSNLAIACLICCGMAFATIIILPIVWLLGFCLIIVTIGAILALIPNYWSKLLGLSDVINKFGIWMLKIGPYVAGAGIGFACISILLLALQKNKKNKGRIIATSIVCVFLIVGLILCIIER